MSNGGFSQLLFEWLNQIIPMIEQTKFETGCIGHKKLAQGVIGLRVLSLKQSLGIEKEPKKVHRGGEGVPGW